MMIWWQKTWSVMLGRQRMIKPLCNATARVKIAHAVVSSISVQLDFLWDDFWPSNGQ
jgi:hypothetical protein